MTLYVAPARYVLTAIHLADDGAARTLCGKPMDDDGLWQEVPGLSEPMCRACTLMDSRRTARDRS